MKDLAPYELPSALLPDGPKQDGPLYVLRGMDVGLLGLVPLDTPPEQEQKAIHEEFGMMTLPNLDALELNSDGVVDLEVCHA